jgi:hypothetical protein
MTPSDSSPGAHPQRLYWLVATSVTPWDRSRAGPIRKQRQEFVAAFAPTNRTHWRGPAGLMHSALAFHCRAG